MFKQIFALFFFFWGEGVRKSSQKHHPKTYHKKSKQQEQLLGCFFLAEKGYEKHKQQLVGGFKPSETY